MIGEFCIVRTRSAGTHMGILESMNGTAVLLSNARRLYQWFGAFTLSEVSLHGCDETSRISESVPKILLTEAIEVIPCSEIARKNLSRSRNGVSSATN